ncbi:hypothetical protein M378DRAFT_16846 [Amanita muscaria Koide BX008]|uniref:Uncharacterized protein n=1 Tax=Amanita muscaria (strain Koide BX008) TaxID=946122 RepID=A0A0C2SRS2_AMAMK|nr:hypothetical protein M378DRAFT_16846 [Amanita muscaria Koide BX008]
MLLPPLPRKRLQVRRSGTRTRKDKRLEMEEGISARWRAEEQQQHKREDHHSSLRPKFRQPRDDARTEAPFLSPSYQCRPSHQLDTFRNPLFPIHLRPIHARRLRSLQSRVGQPLDPTPTLLLLLRARDCKSTAPACPTGIKVADRQEVNNCPGDASDDRLEENDEEGDEEGSFTGGGADTRSFKSRRSTGIDIIQDKCSCDGSLVDFVPGPGQYAERVRSTSSGKSRRQGTTTGSTSTSNSNRQAIAGG